MIIYIFPEAGLVLFMAIYHWVSIFVSVAEPELESHGAESFSLPEPRLHQVVYIFEFCNVKAIGNESSAGTAPFFTIIYYHSFHTVIESVKICLT
jgi:hypothetical protein